MVSFSRRWFGLVVAVALFPGSARAQTVAHSFEELQRILKADDIVIVIDKTGQETRGKVAALSASSLVLLIPAKPSGGLDTYAGAKRTFEEDVVAEVLESDSSGRKGPRIYRAPARSFQDLQRTLKAGQQVVLMPYPSNEAGREIRAIVSALSATSLVLLIDGMPREFREDSVAHIDRPGDRLKNGILIGMTAGFVVPAAIIFGLCQPHSGGECVEALFAPVVGPPWGLLGAGIGAAAGAGIDAMVGGRTRIYASPRKTSGVTLSPLLAKDRRGALVSVRF